MWHYCWHLYYFKYTNQILLHSDRKIDRQTDAENIPTESNFKLSIQKVTKNKHTSIITWKCRALTETGFSQDTRFATVKPAYEMHQICPGKSTHLHASAMRLTTDSPKLREHPTDKPCFTLFCIRKINGPVTLYNTTPFSISTSPHTGSWMEEYHGIICILTIATVNMI